jgi:hypothetical protein
MGMNRITRRFAAWIACFAILFAALAPSISHAVSAPPAQSWAEICSVGGAKFVKVSDAGDGTSDPVTKKSPHLENCPFCATHAGSFGLPPGVSIAIPLIETQDTHPSLFFQSPYPLAVWTTAQSRAPPAQA